MKKPLPKLWQKELAEQRALRARLDHCYAQLQHTRTAIDLVLKVGGSRWVRELVRLVLREQQELTAITLLRHDLYARITPV